MTKQTMALAGGVLLAAAVMGYSVADAIERWEIRQRRYDVQAEAVAIGDAVARVADARIAVECADDKRAAYEELARAYDHAARVADKQGMFAEGWRQRADKTREKIAGLPARRIKTPG